MNMKFIVFSVFIACATLGCYSATCNSPTPIVPSYFLDSIFDTAFTAIRSQNALNNVISDPSAGNIKLYFLTFAPAVIPLWVMAGVTFFAFIGCCFQIICFDICGNEKCGNEIGTSTYNPTAVKCGIIWYLLIAVIGIALCIASMVISSDLAQQANYTACNTQQVSDQFFSGSTNPLTPWSGADNFNSLLNTVSNYYQDGYPTLSSYFSSANAFFTTITNTSTGSYYSNAVTYNCQTYSNTIVCPFFDSSQCPTSTTPAWSAQYCDPNINTSAQARITAEMKANQTVWMNSIKNISTLLNTLGSDTTNISSLQTSVSDFYNVVAPYESSINSGLTSSGTTIYNFQIAAYVFYAFIILSSLIGFMVIVCGFCLRKYSCKCLLNILWIIFMVLGVLLFVLSGFMLAASFATYDSCSSYSYFFKNQTNFNTLTFTNKTIGQILYTCYFTQNTSIFAAFNQSAASVQNINTLTSTYAAALPASSFTTVGNTIIQTLYSYIYNPNTVTFSVGTSANSPQTALNQANTFANYSAPGSTQPGTSNNCNITQDLFAFNAAACNNFPPANPPINSCVVVNNQTTAASITTRVNSFPSTTCTQNQAANYTGYYYQLLNYTNSMYTLANMYITDGNINTYMQAYGTYYSATLSFLNQQVQNIFNSFLTPYNQMNSGNSCAFLTQSFNSLTSTACNAVFPYLNALSILTICVSATSFILMVLSYYMKTRLQFYQFLEGDYDNYAKPIRDKDLTDGVELDTRNNQFLNASDRR